ncbi:MAG: PEP/pyruvate-binding domain-containing protein [Bacteroidota bacterium]
MNKIKAEELLAERSKELNCLYSIEEVLSKPQLTLDEILGKIAILLPEAFRFNKDCKVKISIDNKFAATNGFKLTKKIIRETIFEQNKPVGEIVVAYDNENYDFLDEEKRLVKTLADRFGHFLLYSKLKKLFAEAEESGDLTKKEWFVVLDIIKKTDQNLFSIISRKMLNNLFCKGIEESKQLFAKLGTNVDIQSSTAEENRPTKKQVLEISFYLGNEIFEVAAKYLSDDEILALVQKWIYEDKSHFLIKALANLNTPLPEIADAIRRFYNINPISIKEITTPLHKGILVALIRRFLTDQLEYIEIAKNYINISDFYDILQNMIFTTESHGKLGGKSAGILLAKKIVDKLQDEEGLFKNIKTPKTWYITSDGLMAFLNYNNLEDIIEQKYKPLEEIRYEYPHIIQAFKNSHFPQEIVNGLSNALDNFGDHPIIVRSSSLLEDRLGSAFAGKYKSLFLANQGSKKERLEALLDAIAEVYASTFSPDPIGYRTERQLLDFNEEMGIMIQEVVGKRVGKYFFPAFAGVAFSNNEFRWSPRIRREDGLVRLVPGLGTRAVDRIGNDYPILVAPGQPDLRVNITFQDVISYSPKYIDVINLEKNTFETISIDSLIKSVGNSYPMINEVFSIIEQNHIKHPFGLGIDTNRDEIVVTFENLISKTKYIKQINKLLNEISRILKTPVDIEFACDGDSLYLLQCRPQSSALEGVAAQIPSNIPPDKLIFSANKHISNGKVGDITYVVYVDPEAYAHQESLEKLKDIGRAVSKLNKLLPKRTFILMGPGRWGSRDDIRLGVKVTYSDINNTAVLVEIAKKKGSYVPDLSFGTHFFQDLVESQIRYIPLYPDEDGVAFNYDFFYKTENTLSRWCPEYEHLQDVLKVINVREATNGLVLRVLMNADENLAVAMLADPVVVEKTEIKHSELTFNEIGSDEPLQWRKRMIDSILEHLDPVRFGVKELYLYGSVFLGNATAKSDIDFICIFNGSEEQKKELKIWIEGWNLALSRINYNKTGFKLDRLIDFAILTEKELEQQKYYAELVDLSKNKSKKLRLLGENI